MSTGIPPDPNPNKNKSLLSSTEPTYFTPETLECDLLAHLSNTSVLEDLHTTLLCSLQRMGWVEKIRKLTAELLRAGRCERFDDVVDAVVATAEGRKHAALASAGLDANGNIEDSEVGAYFESVDVRIPRVVVEQGVKVLKEALGEVVILDGEDDEDGKTDEGNTTMKGQDPQLKKLGT